ncbi:MAG: hypothetical protein A3D52_02660 [Candidatus Taylorbacteria bacterium RIFCSPHIGHO2_02_FULL_44_36]|uniref:Uncharacterized protein n=1 Tax=Candidatus Taylorbacteria bacterium RIFCSPLOWO2_12_FULL_44_15c TaxID=1802333 RepID=A0A1G2P4W3_9BACT|nr:MAG: hypothetical protein A3D52_02660 [Candidatus Taylorbacteria bacterium RIFCSPHIGHO2_02_FULL_44_36]OHA38023.1 MAG: hypothetical protein A3I97_02935 [Candidatus Taylorbacteria bacterium RIFCSPLOWO2_02_FULL_44_35]OHA43407.1 MAG: hypothetical protein A3G03_01155 [Candidatus Taylorbacteria bacterium RIFCSPLOWO2_12_FULL_44_15c]
MFNIRNGEKLMTNIPLELLLDLTSDPEQSTKAQTEILRRFRELKQKLKESEANARRRSGQKFDGPIDGQAGEAD